MEITQQELEILNFYRASALHGGLVLGRMAARAADPRLILTLTRQSAEEIRHAQYWSETILAVGGRSRPVRATYQRRFASRVGHPSSLLHVLAATYVFEERAYRHFLEHVRRGTHWRVLTTLHRLIEEEKHHIAWVREWLERQVEIRGTEVTDLLSRYSEADAQLYLALLQEFGCLDESSSRRSFFSRRQWDPEPGAIPVSVGA